MGDPVKLINALGTKLKHVNCARTFFSDDKTVVFKMPGKIEGSMLDIRGALHSSSALYKLCPPLPQMSMYFLRTYSMLRLVCCCIHLCARFKNVEMLSLVLDGISG